MIKKKKEKENLSKMFSFKKIIQSLNQNLTPLEKKFFCCFFKNKYNLDEFLNVVAQNLKTKLFNKNKNA